jgi:hypothetical protein
MHVCDSCGKTYEEALKSKEVISQRGYFWHSSCAKVCGSEVRGGRQVSVVAFPSEGMFVPETILTPSEE